MFSLKNLPAVLKKTVFFLYPEYATVEPKDSAACICALHVCCCAASTRDISDGYLGIRRSHNSIVRTAVQLT